MSAQVASLQLNVDHLKKQSEMNRIKVSEASRDIIDYTVTNGNSDPLLATTPNDNPFREKKACILL